MLRTMHKKVCGLGGICMRNEAGKDPEARHVSSCYDFLRSSAKNIHVLCHSFVNKKVVSKEGCEPFSFDAVTDSGESEDDFLPCEVNAESTFSGRRSFVLSKGDFGLRFVVDSCIPFFSSITDGLHDGKMVLDKLQEDECGKDEAVKY